LRKKKILLKKEGNINIYGIEYETYPSKVASALNAVLKVLQIADLLYSRTKLVN
jgi:hypothetical protein